MINIQSLDDVADCRYCSQVSKANGEDPVGSAQTVDYWLLVEVKQPWPKSMFAEHPLIAQVIATVEKLIFKRGRVMMPAAIAPDPDYSTPGYTRVIYYHRPDEPFAQYVKQEYWVPDEQAGPLVLALLNRLLGKTADLSPFAPYEQATQNIREMLVCTHTQIDLACGRFGTPLYRQLRQTYAQPDSSLRVWQSTHFGGHQFAPTLVDLPTGHFWGHLELGSLPQLVERTGDHRQMKRFYRGWSGCTRFEQIAEREAWMQVGWDWFAYPKRIRTKGKGLTGKKRWLYSILRWIPIKLLQLWLERWTDDASWATIKITYTAPHKQGDYQITVEEKGEVISARNSVAEKNQKISTLSVKQYQISQCTAFTEKAHT
ncbi:MAG: sucrase ferredoxin [Leptolyngbya sp. SIO4C5]|nr:sucrase ferredoxin [Leptolyngbya sp. SIO4C5]